MNINIGNYFEDFVKKQIKSGRYENSNEVICSALRFLEKQERKFRELQNSIKKDFKEITYKSRNSVKFEISINDRNGGISKMIYITIGDGETFETKEIIEDLLLGDYNRQGQLIGIEILVP